MCICQSQAPISIETCRTRSCQRKGNEKGKSLRQGMLRVIRQRPCAWGEEGLKSQSTKGLHFYSRRNGETLKGLRQGSSPSNLYIFRVYSGSCEQSGKRWGLQTSLVAQWLRIRLPKQGTQVRALVREDPTCCGAAKPVRHNYWACALEPECRNYWAHVPQPLKPARLEPMLRNKRSLHNEKPTHCNEE